MSAAASEPTFAAGGEPRRDVAGEIDLASLLDALESGGRRLRDGAVWYVGHAVAGALARAHASTDEEGNPAPVVSLALCPRRVRIAPDGRVRVAGLGAFDALVDAPVEAAPGSPEAEFDAPEQRGGGRVTHRADVYRLGLLLWSLLARRSPPADGARPERLSELRGDLPSEITAAIDAALEPSASRRTTTCMEIEQWLESADGGGEAGLRALREDLVWMRSERAPEREVSQEPRRSQAAAVNLVERPEPAARPLTPLQSIAVALITAALVVAVGVAIGDRALAAGW